MSDDLGKKISQITELLGQEGMPDNLKGLLSLLVNSAPKQESGAKPVETPSTREERVTKSDLDDNIEMIRKVKKVMDRLNNSNDPRIHLLTAIKPFLNTRRQKKIGHCIKLISMSSMTRLLDDTDLFGK